MRQLFVLAVEPSHALREPVGQARVAPRSLRLGERLIRDFADQVGAEAELARVHEEQILDDQSVERVGGLAVAFGFDERAERLHRTGAADDCRVLKDGALVAWQRIESRRDEAP